MNKWLEAIHPFRKLISYQLGQEIVVEMWGKNWVRVPQNLDDEDLAVERISRCFAKYIEAAYTTIEEGFKAVGR